MCDNNPVFEFLVLFVKFSDPIPIGSQVGTCPRLGLLGVDGDKKRLHRSDNVSDIKFWMES